MPEIKFGDRVEVDAIAGVVKWSTDAEVGIQTDPAYYAISVPRGLVSRVVPKLVEVDDVVDYDAAVALPDESVVVCRENGSPYIVRDGYLNAISRLRGDVIHMNPSSGVHCRVLHLGDPR